MNSPTSKTDFFVVGGTIPPDAPSYIQREADRELFERTQAGDFCYVLTPRQMGKSSLMARTAKRLQAQGVATAIVDLTQIGTEKEKKSAEQWYYGIAHRILRELGLKANLNEWWRERNNLPALQRLTEFFSDLVLAQTTNRVVIFVDEIDSTIALQFTDDFFAAIRACHNARATDPAYQRLGFVLLGVASPSDLMKDPQRTPFNIGHRIELTDFSFDEARPLAKGLSANDQRGEQALQRIFHWTSGHPYLTQKLGEAVSLARVENCSDAEIDGFVDRLFLSPEAHRQDHNLNFVRDRLIADRKRSRHLLKLYRRVRLGQKALDDVRSPVHATLKLSGLVVAALDRRLNVRNRIYERVFTAEWAKHVMPVDWRRNLLAITTNILFAGLVATILFVITTDLPSLVFRPPTSSRSFVEDTTPQNLAFREQFNRAISDFVVQNYSKAIENLERISTSGIENTPSDKVLLYDYYFYLGSSYLGQANNKHWFWDARQKRLSAVKAIYYFQRADSLAIINKFNLDYEIKYYLGSAYKLAGNNHMAIEQLKQVPDSSSFYKVAQRNIEEWSNK